MPWVRGKHRLTKTYAWFQAGWAKRLSWKEVAEVFHTTWDHVFSSVEMAVTWGCEHRELSGIEAVGVDEIQWRQGHRYLTLVYQIDESCGRLLWIGKGYPPVISLEGEIFLFPGGTPNALDLSLRSRGNKGVVEITVR